MRVTTEFREPSTVDTQELREVDASDLPALARIFARDQFHAVWDVDYTATSEWLANNLPAYRHASDEEGEDIFDRFMHQLIKAVGDACAGIDVEGPEPGPLHTVGPTRTPFAHRVGEEVGAARAKGTAAETAVVNYLRFQGWPYAERRALSGPNDKGDVTGTPDLVWEVKAGNRLDVPGWLRETEVERVNARASYGILVVKPQGVGLGNVDRWWTVLPFYQTAALLRGAGYGEQVWPRGSVNDS